MGVLWKVCTVVVNCHLKMSVVLHDALHGFIEGWGMGTDTLEANMAQKMDRLAHEPLFQVLLDVSKAYELLERGKCMEILSGQGSDPSHAPSIFPYTSPFQAIHTPY